MEGDGERVERRNRPPFPFSSLRCPRWLVSQYFFSFSSCASPPLRLALFTGGSTQAFAIVEIMRWLTARGSPLDQHDFCSVTVEIALTGRRALRRSMACHRFRCRLAGPLGRAPLLPGSLSKLCCILGHQKWPESKIPSLSGAGGC